mmetsp:Transcript_21283/g.32149  ORF Transcript_21283/g.32149 Transcript_21283/m.32149 type:complete len:209 (-) Transcript_21283:957-1583(-)
MFRYILPRFLNFFPYQRGISSNINIAFGISFNKDLGIGIKGGYRNFISRGPFIAVANVHTQNDWFQLLYFVLVLESSGSSIPCCFCNGTGGALLNIAIRMNLLLYYLGGFFTLKYEPFFHCTISLLDMIWHPISPRMWYPRCMRMQSWQYMTILHTHQRLVSTGDIIIRFKITHRVKIMIPYTCTVKGVFMRCQHITCLIGQSRKHVT